MILFLDRSTGGESFVTSFKRKRGRLVVAGWLEEEEVMWAAWGGVVSCSDSLFVGRSGARKEFEQKL